MKKCTKCKQMKPIEEFYKLLDGKYHFSECKKCYKSRVKTRYAISEIRPLDAGELKRFFRVFFSEFGKTGRLF